MLNKGWGWVVGCTRVTIKASRASRIRHGRGREGSLGKGLIIPYVGFKHYVKLKRGGGIRVKNYIRV